jgi:hypothetical protein
MPIFSQYLIAATILSAIGFPPWLLSQELPKCADVKVEYSAFDEAYSNRMVIRAPVEPKAVPSPGAKDYSPHTSISDRAKGCRISN